MSTKVPQAIILFRTPNKNGFNTSKMRFFKYQNIMRQAGKVNLRELI